MEMEDNLFLIAEIGINHNGDIDLAKELIKDAALAGFDAVKLQKRTIEKVYTKEFLDSPRESPFGTTQRDQKEALEFSIKEHKLLKDYANDLGLKFSASCWDKQAFYDMQEVGVDFWKIASPMLRHHELLKLTSSTKLYTYISTGMSSLNEIEDAVNMFREQSCPFELMHCVSTYPLKEENANLNCIKNLKDKFQCNVGYSGHETSLYRLCAAAVALGASSIEKHITKDRAMYGSDQAASIETHSLSKFVSALKAVKRSLGDGNKIILDDEIPIRLKLSSEFK